MRRRRFLKAGLAAALICASRAIAFSASAPGAPSITVYSSPT